MSEHLTGNGTENAPPPNTGANPKNYTREGLLESIDKMDDLKTRIKEWVDCKKNYSLMGYLLASTQFPFPSPQEAEDMLTIKTPNIPKPPPPLENVTIRPWDY